MAKIAKILPLPVESQNGVMTTQNALAEKGYMRHPGTGVGIVPIKLPNGKYLTGLDPEADYIKRILLESDRNAEIERVTERKERLEKATGLDLGPKSEYYSGVYGPKFGTHEVASRVKLIDGENVFNFNNAFKEVEFWWVIQNKDLIAPSLEQWKSGKCSSKVQFYINNPEEEAELVYSKKKAANKAIKDLEHMSLDKRKKVARLLGLPISENDKEEIVYNQLDAFIKTNEIKLGEHQGQDPVALFNRIAGLSEVILTTKDLVKTALRLRVYIKKHGIIYEGEQIIANSEDELVTELSSPKKQLEYLALESKVNDKMKMKALA